MELKTVSADELRELGFNPECVMTSQRTPGRPVRVRYGDHLVSRSAQGRISIAIGYFTPHQIAFRKAWCDAISATVTFPLLRRRELAVQEQELDRRAD